MRLYAEAQQRIVDDLPVVPLIFGAEYAALRAAVNGFEWIPTRSRLFASFGSRPAEFAQMEIERSGPQVR